MALSGVHQKDLIAYDGTKIRYQDLGEGPPIVLANGLGGTFDAWVYLVRHLSKKYRILSWDYRGLYRSGRPDLLRLTIPDHVDDLARIMDKEGVEKALFLGWSMGTQVILEHAIRRPDRVNGIVLLCGAAGRPFDTALHTSLSRYAMPAAFTAMKSLHKPFRRLVRLLAGLPHGIDAITATRLFWKAGSEVIKELVGDFVELDMEAYAQVMLELGRHDARPLLSEIKAPVFVLAATKDFFTPVGVALKTSRMIPDCEIKILEGATHYAPLEQPDTINAFLDDFISRKVRWPKKAAAPPAKKRKPRKGAKRKKA